MSRFYHRSPHQAETRLGYCNITRIASDALSRVRQWESGENGETYDRTAFSNDQIAIETYTSASQTLHRLCLVRAMAGVPVRSLRKWKLQQGLRCSSAFCPAFACTSDTY
jgi:hypothetical protein